MLSWPRSTMHRRSIRHLRSNPVSFARPAVVGVNTDLNRLKGSDAQKSQRLVREMLREAGWMEEKLKHRPKEDIKNDRMAARVRTGDRQRPISNRFAIQNQGIDVS